MIMIMMVMMLVAIVIILNILITLIMALSTKMPSALTTKVLLTTIQIATNLTSPLDT